MIPVQQTLTVVDVPNRILGNCFQACIASIFELPLDGVPHFLDLGWKPDTEDNGWWWHLRDWLRPRGYVYIDLPNHPDTSSDFWDALGFTVLTGKSPRGDWKHSVVGKGLSVVHDPHPSGDGLVGPPELVGILIALDPCR